ncbi:hypothetical protein AX15_004169 [Amanita polypyramis BW_CC]|nr:hypothetical protein AX15_004169 [Amanita polypyramis BW_CC]
MAVFDGVVFHLSSSLSNERHGELKHVLLQYGAREAKSIHLATHIITNTNNFEGCQDVGAQVAVVTDMWVERSVILDKEQLPSHYSADPAMIFSGVVACATELPSIDVEVLSAGITALGGQWRTALTRDVTHLFCVSNTSPKYETAMHFKEQTHVHVILPHWFDDSVRLGVRELPIESYEWPDPPYLRRPFEMEGLTKSKESDHVSHKSVVDKKTLYKSMVSDEHNTLPSQSMNIWNGRRIMLSTSLELTSSRRRAVEAGIARCGGIIVPYLKNNGDGSKEEETENISKCDVLVTRWRSGRAYVRAVRGSKTIGTLGWVFYIHATGVVSRPMDQLLHYPIPRRPIEGFSSHEITVTNYTGEAREYLKKLITKMGATFTPSMSGRNTVLIAAQLSGTKTTKAAAWSIPIVNHTWLEDCFVKWRNLTVGVEKYIVFPPGIDFSNLLGERGVGGGFTIAGITNPDTIGNKEGVGVGGWVGLESEEELEALEREDDLFDAEMASMDDEGSVGGEVDRPLVIDQTSSPVWRKANTSQERPDVNDDHLQNIRILPSSPGTQGSTDTREVEAVVNFMQGDEDSEIVEHSSRTEQKGDKNAKIQQQKGTSSQVVGGSARSGPGGRDMMDLTPVGSKSGRKTYIAEAVEITKSPSSRRKTSKIASNDETEENLKMQAKKSHSRVGIRDSSAEPSTRKDELTNRDRGKLKKVVDDEEDDDVELGEGSCGQDGDQRRSTSWTKSPVGKMKGATKKKGKAIEESEGSDETHDTPKNGKAKERAKAMEVPDETNDDDEGEPVVQQLKSEKKKMVGKGKKNEAREEEESEEGSIPGLRRVKTGAGKRVESNKRSKSDITIKRKPKKATKESDEEESDEEESDHERENNSRGRDTSGAHPSKKVDKRGKSMDEEDEDISPKMKSLSTPSRIRDSSPLSPPPKSPDTSTSARLSKRSAALKASRRLHNEIMPDMNSYQSELKKGRISLGSAQERLLKAAERYTSIVSNRKRKGTEDEDDEDEPTSKKKHRVSFEHSAIDSRKDVEDSKDGIKTARSPKSNVMLLTTQVILSDDVIKALVKLGIKMTSHATECTHLIAPKIVRTEKFLCAIASAPFVLTEEWAIRSAAAKKLLPEKSFLLQDEEGEGRFSFKLRDAIERAKRRKIFAGKTFYVTPRVQTSLQLLRNVITSCGGQLSITTPTVRILNASSNRHVISCPEDISVWRPLAAHHPVYNQELVLTGALKQLAEWDNDAFRVPNSL